MSLPWIKVWADLPDHPRVYDLAAALDVPPTQAIGHLVALWSWLSRYAPDGVTRQSRDSRATIARASRWDRDPVTLTDALVATGWIVVEDSGEVRACGWEDRQTPHLRKMESDRKRSAQFRAKRSQGESVQRATANRATISRRSRESLSEVAGEIEIEIEKKKVLVDDAARHDMPAPEPAQTSLAGVETTPASDAPAKRRKRPALVVECEEWLSALSAKTNAPAGAETASRAIVIRWTLLRKSRSVEELHRVIDGLASDDWWRTKPATAWLSDAGIAEGLKRAAARATSVPKGWSANPDSDAEWAKGA